jgi:hypothetical protein
LHAGLRRVRLRCYHARLRVGRRVWRGRRQTPFDGRQHLREGHAKRPRALGASAFSLHRNFREFFFLEGRGVRKEAVTPVWNHRRQPYSDGQKY